MTERIVVNRALEIADYVGMVVLRSMQVGGIDDKQPCSRALNYGAVVDLTGKSARMEVSWKVYKRVAWQWLMRAAHHTWMRTYF